MWWRERERESNDPARLGDGGLAMMALERERERERERGDEMLKGEKKKANILGIKYII